MTWNHVLTLLHIAQMANDFPKLHDLRNAAVDALEAVDTSALTFDDWTRGEEE